MNASHTLRTFGACCALTLGWLAPEAAHAACSTTAAQISGFLYNPYSGKTISGSARPALTFDGILNGPNVAGDNQVIYLQVFDPEEPRWVTKQTLPATGSGLRTWSATGSFLNPITFPDGGIARVRAIWENRCNRQTKDLTVVDTQGLSLPQINGEAGNQILVDVDPDPTTLSKELQPQYLSYNANLFPPGTPDREAKIQAETLAYYNAVRTGPRGGGPSLSASLGTLKDFQERYFAGRQETSARYYNRGDLGIGREMHCVFQQDGESACYVFNFAPLVNGIPQFGDEAGSLKAQFVDRAVPFAAVAMVERGAMDPEAKDHMFFAVYVCAKKSGETQAQHAARCQRPAEHGLFSGPVPLDATGHNSFNPGNCINCHGVSSRYDEAAHGIYDAQFLPFDTDAFEFPTEDPNRPNSRRAQHDAFRALNKGVYESDFGLLPSARQVRAWYGGFWQGQFNGGAVPVNSDWLDTPSSSRVFNDVYAKGCRTCHISGEGTAAFSTFEAFKAYDLSLSAYVCGRAMPHAQQTLRQFWHTDARAVMLGHLGLSGECGNGAQ